MDNERALEAYVLGLSIDRMEPYLQARGFGNGLVLFALPELGIQFKCRVEGEGAGLQMGALLSLLQFLKKKLSNEKIAKVKVYASDPSFVFAIAHMTTDKNRKNKQLELIKKYLKNITLELAIIPMHRNLACYPPTAIPSTPKHVKPVLSIEAEDNRPRFQTLQKGISLK